MRIALFTDSYTPYVSGVVRSIERFTKGLTKLGHEVYIFAPGYAKKETSRDVCDAARVFRFFSVPAPTCPNFSLPIPLSPKIDRLVKRLGIDIIHTHSPFIMGRLGASLAYKHGLPLVFTHHTLYHEYVHYVPAPNGLTRQMVIHYIQRYCKRCNAVIAPTNQVQEMIISLYRLSLPVYSIPTGIDLDHYQQGDKDWLKSTLKIPVDHRVLIFVGRLGKEKNPQLVLDTFKLLAQKYPKLHLVFVGDGPEKLNLSQQTNSEKLKGRVHFTGVLGPKEVVNAYLGADIFVFGSVTETQGLVTVEAMAGGLPVVAVDASGTRDIVTHNRDGFLAPSQSEKLAEHVDTLLKDPLVYQRIQKNALTTANDYSIASTATQLATVYDRALATHKRKPSLLYRWQ